MEYSGGSGRSARHYGDELAVLYGRLTIADLEPDVVYPDNYCPYCAKDGVDAGDRCFHKHWVKDDGRDVVPHDVE